MFFFPPKRSNIVKIPKQQRNTLRFWSTFETKSQTEKARVTFFCCSIPVFYHMEAITPQNLAADYSVFDEISSVSNPSSRDSGVTVLHT